MVGHRLAALWHSSHLSCVRRLPALQSETLSLRHGSCARHEGRSFYCYNYHVLVLDGDGKKRKKKNKNTKFFIVTKARR